LPEKLFHSPTPDFMRRRASLRDGSENMRVEKRKALIFTTDALLALAAITIAATAFTIFETQTPSFGKQTELAQLGRDYLQLGAKADADWLYENTGLRVTSNARDFANNALTVRATLCKYPELPKACGCTPDAEGACNLPNDACFKKQDASTPDGVIEKIWVSP
jgi:hypothetical protein